MESPPPARKQEPEQQAKPQADQAPDEQPVADGLDLLTVALLVFFVSLIAIVGAMLLLPALG